MTALLTPQNLHSWPSSVIRHQHPPVVSQSERMLTTAIDAVYVALAWKVGRVRHVASLEEQGNKDSMDLETRSFNSVASACPRHFIPQRCSVCRRVNT